MGIHPLCFDRFAVAVQDDDLLVRKLRDVLDGSFDLAILADSGFTLERAHARTTPARSWHDRFLS
jgi:hypothetical protein